ncbi:TetR family transcriptional regulator [Prolixibacteraceae bacterium Z1-6]|uniref:Biofilm operon icaADBC HTH-type negative transcriptional regulator IcaR n=1 Tax=Draconibacterium aestuarii TaxID=2998507 RepID=A0A9X3FE92_9BACT|nr:TetR family transcriptional regulator [Prolixibacteraceae bacterium Z1-6]
MGRKSLKDTRQKEIVKAFYDVAKKVGIENASIAKVANVLGVNPSLVMHYFKTKDDLLQALVDFNLEKYLAIYSVKDKVDTKEKLVQIIENLFSRKWHRLFDDGVYYSCYSFIYRNRRFKNEFKELHDSLHKNFVVALTQATENGVINITDFEKTTKLVFSVVDGAYYYLGMVDDDKEMGKISEWYKEHVLSILGIIN